MFLIQLAERFFPLQCTGSDSTSRIYRSFFGISRTVTVQMWIPLHYGEVCLCEPKHVMWIIGFLKATVRSTVTHLSGFAMRNRVESGLEPWHASLPIYQL